MRPIKNVFHLSRARNIGLDEDSTAGEIRPERRSVYPNHTPAFLCEEENCRATDSSGRAGNEDSLC
jgi:hypothetical protein